MNRGQSAPKLAAIDNLKAGTLWSTEPGPPEFCFSRDAQTCRCFELPDPPAVTPAPVELCSSGWHCERTQRFAGMNSYPWTLPFWHCFRGFLKPFLKPFPAARPKAQRCGWVGAVLGEGDLGAVAFQRAAPASRCHQSARRRSPASGHVLLSLASAGEAEIKRGQIQVKAGNPVSKSNVSSFFFFFFSFLPPF